MKPNDPVPRLIKIEDAAGNGVPALDVSDLDIIAMYAAYGETAHIPWTHGSTLVPNADLPDGWYDLLYTAPPAAGNALYRATPVSAAYRITTPNEWSGEIENQDVDSLFGTVAQPVATLSSTVQLGAQLPLELVPYRYRTLVIPVQSAGVPVPLDGYTNWRLGIRSKDQTTTRLDADNGKHPGLSISGDIDGNLSITLPESMVGPQYTTWAAARAYAKGDFAVPTVNNGFVYQCTTAGTSHAVTQPTWPTTVGLTVNDNGVIWTAQLRTIWLTGLTKAVGGLA